MRRLVDRVLEPRRRPGYWMNETSGELAVAVQRYLSGEQLRFRDIRLLRSYLDQWINAPVWAVDASIIQLRAEIPGLRTREDIARWTELALEANVDPW